MLRILLALFLFTFTYKASAQQAYQLTGARAAGMAYASVATSDVWAMQYNIGALADVSSISLAAGYQTRFNLPELATSGLVLAVPTTIGVAGASISRYGFGPLHQTEASLGFSHKIHLVSLGVQAGFVQTATKGFGSRIVPVLSAGGAAELMPGLRFGGYVYNLGQSMLHKETGERLPTLLRAGLQWQPSAPLLLALETEKDVDFPARFKAGVQYRVRPFLALRTGISTHPVNLHGGVGLYPGNFSFDYALEHHSYMGIMHHLTFGWKLKKP